MCSPEVSVVTFKPDYEYVALSLEEKQEIKKNILNKMQKNSKIFEQTEKIIDLALNNITHFGRVYKFHSSFFSKLCFGDKYYCQLINKNFSVLLTIFKVEKILTSEYSFFDSYLCFSLHDQMKGLLFKQKNNNKNKFNSYWKRERKILKHISAYSAQHNMTPCAVSPPIALFLDSKTPLMFRQKEGTPLQEYIKAQSVLQDSQKLNKLMILSFQNLQLCHHIGYAYPEISEKQIIVSLEGIPLFQHFFYACKLPNGDNEVLTHTVRQKKTCANKFITNALVNAKTNQEMRKNLIRVDYYRLTVLFFRLISERTVISINKENEQLIYQHNVLDTALPEELKVFFKKFTTEENLTELQTVGTYIQKNNIGEVMTRYVSGLSLGNSGFATPNYKSV